MLWYLNANRVGPQLQSYQALNQTLAPLSQEEAGILSSTYQQQLQFEEVFWLVWQRYESILRHPKAHFVYDSGYHKLLDANGQQAVVSVLTLSAMSIICLYTTFAMEFKGGMISVLSTTPLGRKATARRKMMLACLITLVLFLMMEIPRFLVIYEHYGFRGLGAPAQSLPFLSGIPTSISILGYLILFQCLKLLTSLVIAFVILLISLKAKQPFLILLISVLALLLAPVLTYLGLPMFRWLSLIPIFQMSFLLSNSFWIFIIYLLAMLGGFGIMYRYLEKSFMTKKILIKQRFIKGFAVMI